MSNSYSDQPSLLDLGATRSIATVRVGIEPLGNDGPLVAPLIHRYDEEPMPLSYFAAALQCPVCGTLSAADSTTDMSADLLPDFHVFHPGDALDLPVGRYHGAYVALRPLATGEPVRIVTSWVCRACLSGNWAEIVIATGVLQRIEPVALNAALLGRAHFITDDIDQVFEDLTGQPLYVNGVPRADFVRTLQQQLP